MSEESAAMILWGLGVVIFLIAMYSVASVGKEMGTSIKGQDQASHPNGS